MLVRTVSFLLTLIGLAGCSNSRSPAGVYELIRPERIGSFGSVTLELRSDGTASVSAPIVERTRKGEMVEKLVRTDAIWTVLNDASPSYLETLSSAYREAQRPTGRDYVILQADREKAWELARYLFGSENLQQSNPRRRVTCGTPEATALHSITDQQEREKKAKEFQELRNQVERHEAQAAAAAGLINLHGMGFGIGKEIAGQLIVSDDGDLLIPGIYSPRAGYYNIPEEPRVLRKKDFFLSVLRTLTATHIRAAN